jgi:hypothetical protein
MNVCSTASFEKGAGSSWFLVMITVVFFLIFFRFVSLALSKAKEKAAIVFSRSLRYLISLSTSWRPRRPSSQSSRRGPWRPCGFLRGKMNSVFLVWVSKERDLDFFSDGKRARKRARKKSARAEQRIFLARALTPLLHGFEFYFHYG